MKTLLTGPTTIGLALAAGLILLAGAVTTAQAGSDRHVYEPPGNTIVRVEGDKANGFGILHYDGTELFPPTDSEAYAECGEYDRFVERVRCRTEVRVWYRDLTALKRALRYARSR